jgi:hypothetical protein
MSMPVPLRLPHRTLRFIRLPLVLTALAMILFYTVVLITWVPNHGYVYQWGVTKAQQQGALGTY